MKRKKVFCIGLSRTGTTSLCKALNILNYNAIHFPMVLFTNPEVINKSLKFTTQRRLNAYWKWRLSKEVKVIREKNLSKAKDLISSYDAFADLPIPLYFSELDKAFPGSKFIYTFRDEDKWLKSMKWLYEEGSVLWNHGLLHDEIKLAAYGTYVYDDEKLIESFRKHHQQVIEYFSDRPADLLVIKIDQENVDFSVLCRFLEAELPEGMAYPRANETQLVPLKSHANYWLERKLPFYKVVKSKLIS